MENPLQLENQLQQVDKSLPETSPNKDSESTNQHFSESIAQFRIRCANKKIVNFFKKKYFELPCVNESDILGIPGLYRFRLEITNHHSNYYSEDQVSQQHLHNYRRKFIQPGPKIVYFRYCFDIRLLYEMRNQILELYDNFYYLQPGDHIKINKLWKKLNGFSNESIIYLTNFEYCKALSKDQAADYEKDLVQHLINQSENSKPAEVGESTIGNESDSLPNYKTESFAQCNEDAIELNPTHLEEMIRKINKPKENKLCLQNDVIILDPDYLDSLVRKFNFGSDTV